MKLELHSWGIHQQMDDIDETTSKCKVPNGCEVKGMTTFSNCG